MTDAEAVVSPLAPTSFPELPDVAGVRLATLAAGLRYQGRPDLMLAEVQPGPAALTDGLAAMQQAIQQWVAHREARLGFA